MPDLPGKADAIGDGMFSVRDGGVEVIVDCAGLQANSQRDQLIRCGVESLYATYKTRMCSRLKDRSKDTAQVVVGAATKEELNVLERS